MRTYKGVIITILGGLILGGILSCEREGPAERAGEVIDEVIEDAGEALEDRPAALCDENNQDAQKGQGKKSIESRSPKRSFR